MKPLLVKVQQNVEKFAQLANISSHYIIHSAKDYCTEEDFIWITQYLHGYQSQSECFLNGKRGIVYDLADPIERFSAMIGVFIRYLIDARLSNPYNLIIFFEQEIQPRIIFLYGLEYIDTNIKSQLIQFLYNPSFDTIITIQDKMRFQQIYPKDLYSYILNNYQII